MRTSFCCYVPKSRFVLLATSTSILDVHRGQSVRRMKCMMTLDGLLCSVHGLLISWVILGFVEFMMFLMR